MGFFAKMLVLAMSAGLVAGNSDKIEAFYEELMAETRIVVNGMDMRNIAMLLDYDYSRRGRYPSVGGFPQWLEEHFKENAQRDLLLDSWGTPFLYETSDRRKRYRLASAGPDKQTGTGDDIVYTGP
jgi:hypothetical protein